MTNFDVYRIDDVVPERLTGQLLVY